MVTHLNTVFTSFCENLLLNVSYNLGYLVASIILNLFWVNVYVLTKNMIKKTLVNGRGCHALYSKQPLDLNTERFINFIQPTDETFICTSINFSLSLSLSPELDKKKVSLSFFTN